MSVENPQPLAPDPSLRASDADRDRLVSELNEHVVAGRLTTEEFEQRAAQAYSAKTFGDLAALRSDLPLTPRQLAVSYRERRGLLARRMLQETGGSAAAFALCTGIWAINGASGQFWPVWVLLVVAITLVRGLWGLYGPDADLDSFEADLERRRAHRADHRAGHRRR